MAGRGPNYPDLRYLFMRGLIKHEWKQRSRHYLKSAAECTSRAIVSLELSQEPVKSVKQARKLEGIGGETCVKLTKLEEVRHFSCLKPVGGRFVSSAGGILIAMLELTELLIISGHRPDKPALIPEEKVREKAEHFTEETFQSSTDEGFCPAWWRLEVLIKRGYIKRRTLKKKPVLQLLPRGTLEAERLRERVGLPPVLPADLPKFPEWSPENTPEKLEFGSDGEQGIRETTHPKPETISAPSSALEDALYTNDTGANGYAASVDSVLQITLVMLVDIQEMGGERVGLGELCGLIGRRGIVYRTKKLKTGDYSWFWRCGGQDVVLPCLVERKRADDLPRTLKESRLWSQVRKMLEWRTQFEERGLEAKLYYILERRPEEYVVKCTDGCQGIGQCGNPTLPQIKLVIEDLKHHPQLLVRETESLETTVVLLASLTAELQECINEGQFDILLQNASAGSTHENSKLEDLDGEQQKHCHGNKLEQTAELFKAEGPTEVEGLSLRHSESVLQGIRNGLEKTKVENLIEKTKVENLTFEEEIALAIEMSKRETTFKEGNNNSDLIVSESVDKRANLPMECGFKSKTETSDVLHDEDESLLMAIERSQQDVNLSGDIRSNGVLSTLSRKLEGTDATVSDTSFPIPLMQYHCSAGGSVTYPHTPGYIRNAELGGYRPKMNKCGIKGSRASSTYDVRSPQKLSRDKSGGYTRDEIHEIETADRSEAKLECWTPEITGRAPSPFSFEINSLNSEKENIQELNSDKSANFLNELTKVSSFRKSVDLSHSKHPDSNMLIVQPICAQNVTQESNHTITSALSSNKTTGTSGKHSAPLSRLDTSDSDSDAPSSQTLKTKHKKIKLRFTPSCLNTAPEVAKPPAPSSKKTRGRRKRKKGASTLKDVGKDDLENPKTDSSAKTDEPLLHSPNKYSCSIVEIEDSDMIASGGVCKKVDNTRAIQEIHETNKNNNGNRSDEDLFPDYDPCLGTSVGTLCNNDIDEKYRSPYKSSQKTPSVHGTSFSSTHSGSFESLPDLEVEEELKDEEKPVKEPDELRRSVAAKDFESGDGIYTGNDSSHDCMKSVVPEDRRGDETVLDEKRNAKATTPTKRDGKVEMILSVLPHVSAQAAMSTLKTCGGNVELCVSVLLEALGFSEEIRI